MTKLSSDQLTEKQVASCIWGHSVQIGYTDAATENRAGINESQDLFTPRSQPQVFLCQCNLQAQMSLEQKLEQCNLQQCSFLAG